MKALRKQFDALMQGDPQALAVVAVLSFLLSVGWFSFSMLFGNQNKPLPLGSSRPPRQEEPDSLLSQLLEEQQSLDLPEKGNPFYLRPPRRAPRPRPTRDPNDRRPPRVEPTPDGLSKPPRPTPQAPIPTVTYVYRGLITRPDGKTVAMVQIPKEGSTRFVQVGDELPPLTITGILKTGLEYQEGNDRPGAMSLGQTVTFQLSND